MTFVLKNPDTPRHVTGWPVVVQTAADGGKVRKDEITVDYEVISQDAVDAIVAEAQGGQVRANADSALLERVVKNVGGLVDESGQPVVFGDGVLAQLLAQTNVRAAMVAAFFDVASGRRAARKN